MDTVTAPSSTYPHGEHPPPTGEQDEDHHEKKPVLKKVMDKVKKIKKAISKKSPRHGKEGGDGDHHQQGDLDEEEEEFEEDDEIKDDPAVHGGSAAGAGFGAREIPDGEERTKGAGDGLGFIREQFDENQANPRTDNETDRTTELSRSFPNPITEQKRESESPATGESAERDGDGLRLTTEKFVGDLTAPTDDAKANWGIDQSRAYESPATNVRTGENEGAERVGDGLGIIKEESVEDPGAPRNEVYKSPTTGARTGASEGVKNGLGLITDDFVQGSTPPSTEAETDTIMTDSPTSVGRVGANETLVGRREYATGGTDGLGLFSKDFVQDSAAPRSDDVTNKIIEQSQVHLSPTSGARSGTNELSRGAEESADGLDSITNMELVEDPAAPKDEAEKNTITEQSQEGKEAEIAPEIYRSLEAMTVSTQNEGGEPEHLKGGNNTYTGMVSSAASKVYGMVSDAGTTVISKVKPEAGKDGEAEAVGNQSKGRSITEYITEKLTPGEDEKTLSELITEAGQRRNNETVEAAPSEVDDRGTGLVGKIKGTVTSLIGGGGGSPKSPSTELITEAGQKRENETIEVPRQAGVPSNDNEKGTSVVDKIKGTVTSFIGGGGGSPNSPSTEFVTEAGQKSNNEKVEVLSQAAARSDKDERGTGVVDKIKGTVTSLIGSGGVSPNSPSTEFVTEAGQKSNNETVEVPRQATTPSDKDERGTGVVDKIKGTVSSILGSGSGSPKSPSTEVIMEGNNETREVPRQVVAPSNEDERGTGVVDKIKGTVTSLFGGRGSSPKSASAEIHRKETEDNNDFHGLPHEEIGQEKGSSEELPTSYH